MTDQGTVRTVEVDGITLDVDVSRFEDPRFTYALGKVADETLDEFARLTYANRMLDTLFGDDTYRVMCELAAAHGGRLDVDTWQGFYVRVMGAVGSKNS